MKSKYILHVLERMLQHEPVIDGRRWYGENDIYLLEYMLKLGMNSSAFTSQRIFMEDILTVQWRRMLSRVMQFEMRTNPAMALRR